MIEVDVFKPHKKIKHKKMSSFVQYGETQSDRTATASKNIVLEKSTALQYLFPQTGHVEEQI